MGLRKFICLEVAGLIICCSSCNWFNPFESSINDNDFRCITYFLPLDNDSSVCFVSASISLYEQNFIEIYDLCVEVSKVDSSSISTCKSISSDTSSIWLSTGGLNNISPEDTLQLSVDSPEFETMSSMTIAPYKAIISNYSMSSRSYFNGEKYFDEISVEFRNPSENKEAYLIQLIVQVDTLDAAIPSFKNLQTDDQNLTVRKFGDRALENSLFFDDSFWGGETYIINFRTSNKKAEGTPYHYILLAHSISTDMYNYFIDLESNSIPYSNIEGGKGCFGSMYSSQILLFP